MIEWRQMPLKWNATYNLIYRTHPMQCWSSKQRHPEADLRLLQHPRWSSILYVTVVLDPPLKTFWILWPYSTRPGKFLRVSHYWETLVKILSYTWNFFLLFFLLFIYCLFYIFHFCNILALYELLIFHIQISWKKLTIKTVGLYKNSHIILSFLKHFQLSDLISANYMTKSKQIVSLFLFRSLLIKTCRICLNPCKCWLLLAPFLISKCT